MKKTNLKNSFAIALSIIVFVFCSGICQAKTEALSTWLSGSDLRNQAGVYGSKGIGDPNNYPGTRSGGVSWTDSSGDFWLFGGSGRDSAGVNGKINDLWKYDGSEWTWISGSDTIDQAGVYGSIGVVDPNNVPGARLISASWIDGAGVFWLFGGYGRNGDGIDGNLNDLWKYDPNGWTWESGTGTINQAGVYGTMGNPNPANIPGSRQANISWIDGGGNLWLFGGFGFDSAGNIGKLNDLWKYDGNNWSWEGGSNVKEQGGVYGVMGVPTAANTPGARNNSVRWTDSIGNFWLFGGYGLDGTASLGYLNDLWKYDGNMWVWMGGSDTTAQTGTYGYKGESNPNNVPGARSIGVSWVDDADNFWFFGGFGKDIAGAYGNLNDLWKYDGSEWTWVTGSDEIVPGGVYGTKGVADPANIPGPRYSGYTWIDSSDDLWLFGGTGNDIEGNFGTLNDMWTMQITEVKVHYVDDSAVGADDGSDWANAYNNLYDALDAAQYGEEIWAAEGTYLPEIIVAAESRKASLKLKNGVTVEGGYAGYGASDPDERNIKLYESIASGDIGIVSDSSDNCYHVFYHPAVTGLDPNSILDGFTVSGGNADGIDADSYGGGMLNNNNDPTILNCTFTENSAGYFGGAMHNSQCSPTVTNCIFIDNSSDFIGGGMHNYISSNPKVTDCSFIGNTAGSYGGGMRNYSSEPVVTDCIFTGNSADVFGGGMYNNNSGNPTITGCTFTGNSSGYGGGIYVSTSTIIISNSILWGDTAVSSGDEIALVNSSTIDIDYCDVQGGLGGIYSASGSVVNWGAGNIDSDPLFDDADGEDDTPGTQDDNLRLTLDSLCIDVGDNSLVTQANDLDGLTRIVDGDCNSIATVDMGAYELDKLYSADFDGDCDVDYGDFGILYVSWLLDNPAIDIAPYLEPDGIIDLKELLVMANHWLDGTGP